jgi:hypothetical protein
MSMNSSNRPSRKLQPSLQVADQAMRLVLRGDGDAPHPGVHAVRQREVDDAKLAAERHGRFGVSARQLTQPGAVAARHYHGEGAACEIAVRGR